MRAVQLIKCGLIVMLFLSVCNVGQAQDSLGMHCLSGLSYWYSAESIQMVGDLVYVVSGSSGLYIISLADPANPVEVGRFTWFQWYGATGEVYVLGNRAYLGLYGGGFVLDISDSTHPAVLGQWIDMGGSGISFVHNDWAIGQDTEGTPYVLDISDPTNVHQIGDFPVIGPQRGVGIAGEYLCMTGYPGGLVLYDMTNPANPQWVASVDTVFRTHYATISGNYGYVATLHDGLRIIDLSNPLQPVEVAVCDTTGSTFDVTVTGAYAVTTKYIFLGWDHWLNVWNITDPTHPVLESSIHPEALASGLISSSGNLICTTMSGSNNIIMVVDISNPTAPVVVSSFGPYGLLTRMAISGTTAYLADRINGLRTVDLTDPNRMFELAHMNNYDASGGDVAVRGNYAYVMESLNGGLTDVIVVFDVSNPAEPESLGYALYENAARIVTEGDFIYVAGLSHLYTFSLANPAIPQCVNNLNLPSGSPGLGLAALNGYIYWGAGTNFCVCSLSNPAEPQLVGSCNLSGGYVVNLAVAGHYVYAANGYGGMRIVDVSDPTDPSEINWIDGYWVGSVAASGNIAIMVDYLNRINIYDVTNPDDPRLVGYYPTYEYIPDMEIQGQYLFTISESDFRVYQCDALPNSVPPHETFPTEFALLPPYPNPFNSVLTIPFTLPIQEEVIINIYNILGQRVKEFVLPPLYPGAHRVLWDASSCASGIYIIRLISSGKEFNQSALLLK